MEALGRSLDQKQLPLLAGSRPLLNCGNCFSVRLRAPRTGSMDIATYYMSNFLCGYSKALLERGIEGGYNYLDALMASET